MLERLRLLYGDALAERIHGELLALLESHRARIRPRPAPAEPFDQADALLITYADTFQRRGAPPLEALNDFATRHLEGAVSGVHILPFFPYSSDYGFSVKDYLAVDPALGNWDQVDALGARFKLMFDFVLNHVSAGSDWFQAYLHGEAPYDRFFIEVDPATDLSQVTRPRTTPLLTRFDTARGERWVWTTFSPDQVDLNYSNPEVLLRMVDVMLTYVERGADLLRMDAIGYLWKEAGTPSIHLQKTHQVVKLFREVLNSVAPWVAIVTETNVPHADNVSYFGDGDDEAQMVYQFPLAPLVLDAFAQGDASHLNAWAAELRTPSRRTAFFNFLASHDGVGLVPARGFLSDQEVENLAQRARLRGGEVSFKTNPDGGESPYELNATFFDALSDPGAEEAPDIKRTRFLCSQAIMLALAGVPGIYVHSLFGSHNDHAAYARTGWKRDLNHEHLDLAKVEARIADPASEAGAVFAEYLRLLRVRRDQPAFHPNASQRVLDAGSRVFALLRGPRHGQAVVALHNLSADEVAVDPAITSDAGGEAGVDLLTGGRVDTSGSLRLAPYQVLWLSFTGSAP
jgi:sucrose phosphorylase